MCINILVVFLQPHQDYYHKKQPRFYPQNLPTKLILLIIKLSIHHIKKYGFYNYF